MGLLDQFSNLNEEQTQGLLAAASQMLQQSGPSRTPVGFGQILGGGLGAYQDSTLAMRKRKLEEEQAKQMGQLRGLQIQEAQGGLADHERARTQANDLRQFYMQQRLGQEQQATPVGAVAPPQMASAMPGGVDSPKVGGPDWMQAFQSGQSAPTAARAPQQATQGDPFNQRMVLAQQLRQAGFHAEADAQEAAALKFKPKFSTEFRQAMGADGKLHNYQVAEDGQIKEVPLGVKPDMVEVGLGDRKQFVDKNALTPNQSFNMNMTPGERSSAAQSAARLSFDKSQASTADDAVMDPLAIRMTAQQYLAGDSSAMNNFGRGAQGASNLNAVRLEVAKQANAAGMNGADVAAKMAEFAGLKAGQRTAGVRSASIEIAANEVAQLAPIALEASAKVARSGFLPFGKAQIMFDSNTNNPDMRQFAMANTALVNAYGQAMARGGAATVSDKDHARELLSTTFDQPSYAAAVAQLQKETRAAQAAPKQVRKDLSDSVAGRDITAAQPGTAGGALSITAPNGKTYNFPDAKALANFKLSAGIR